MVGRDRWARRSMFDYEHEQEEEEEEETVTCPLFGNRHRRR